MDAYGINVGLWYGVERGSALAPFFLLIFDFSFLSTYAFSTESSLCYVKSAWGHPTARTSCRARAAPSVPPTPIPRMESHVSDR